MSASLLCEDPSDIVASPEVREACAALGWEGLRPDQAEVLRHVLRGESGMAILPTSAGKSALWQIPALAGQGLVVVVSPLIALMIDQVARLQARGLAAGALHSHCTASEKRRVTDGLASGTLRLLYVSPERLQGMERALFRGASIRMFAVDEAHCVSEWGHDFRPAYRRLGQTLRRFAHEEGGIQVLACTATATVGVADEIAEVLGVEDGFRIVRSPDRSNIFWGVVGREVELARMVGRAEEVVGLPCLVYGSTRIGVEAAAEELRRAGYRADHYHAERPREERLRAQDAFAAGELDVLVATCAFGMGVDHRGLRAVVHLEMPSSLEAYSQEAGRAGRDGRPSIAICRATMDALETARSYVERTWPRPETVRRFWARVQSLFEAMQGRWDGAEEVSCTTEDLARRTGLDEVEAGSCVRILVDGGSLARVAHVERPARLTLLSRAFELRGPRQRRAVALLQDHADHEGVVRGTVAFFRDVLDIDHAYARELAAAGAIRLEWAAPGMLLRRLLGTARFDADRVRALAARGHDRIDAAGGYLSSTGCRREALLRYFGAEAPASDRCCDRCLVMEGRRL